MIVDLHVHPPGFAFDAPACDALLAVAARAGVTRVVTLGPVGPPGPYPTPTQIRESNDATLAWLHHSPDQVTGFCYLNPQHDPGFLRDELARCLAGGMRGIKLWIALVADDPRVDGVLDLAAAHHLPVLQHAWYKTVDQYPDESTPAHVAAVGRRHPTVPLICAHLTGGGHRGLADVADVANVLVDTSGSQPVAGLVEAAVRELGAARVLYGSDAPGRDFAPAVARITGAAITPAEQQAILWSNAARLLGWETADAHR